MVPRGELLAAQAEARAHRDEADAKARDLEWRQSQLDTAREHLHATRQESSQMQSNIGDMVPKAEVADLQAAAAQQQAVVSRLKESLLGLEAAKAALEEKLQAPPCHSHRTRAHIRTHTH
jgi:predicted  nucleic acid-binding Zn-ribbon protein